MRRNTGMKLKCPGCVKHIGAAVGMLIVLLLSLEAGLRLHGRHAPPTAALNAPQSPLVVSSARCFHRLKPLLAVGVENPDRDEPIPLLTNSLGLRGDEVAVPKPAGVYRVLLLGDDSTLAAKTPQEQTMTRQLQSFLQSRTHRTIEVINAGVPDYCPLLSYLLLKHSLVGLQPDLIVLNVDMSDVSDDHRYRRFVRADQHGEPLVCRNPRLDDPASARRRKHRRCLVLDWAKRQLGRVSTSGTAHNDGDDISSPLGKYAWIKDRSPDWSMHVRQALQPIDRIERLAKRMGAEFLVAVIPAPWQISANASNTKQARGPAGIPLNALYRSQTPFQTLGEFLRERKIPFCNPVSEFRGTDSVEALYWSRTPRLSPAGHQLFARELAKCITREVPAFQPPRHDVPFGRSRRVPARSATRSRSYPTIQPHRGTTRRYSPH